MESETTRQQKVARQIQKDLAEIIRARGMAAYDGALLTVSGVKITPDLALAKVYVSIFPSTKAEAVMQRLEEETSRLRGELGRRVAKQLRIVPELSFYLDDSLDYVALDSLSMPFKILATSFRFFVMVLKIVAASVGFMEE